MTEAPLLLADALPPPLPQVRNHHLPINSGCASCWAVTTASVIGDRLNMMVERSPGAGASPSPRIEVSAQYLLNCVPGQRHCGYPGSASAAMRYVATHGIPDEACAPWQVRTPTPRAPLRQQQSADPVRARQNAWPEGVQSCDALHICAQMTIDPHTHKPAEFPNHTMHLAPVPNPRMHVLPALPLALFAS